MVSGKLQETGKGRFEPTWQEQWELEGRSMENQIVWAKRMEDRRGSWLGVSKKNGRSRTNKQLGEEWEWECWESGEILGTERKAQGGSTTELGNSECKGRDTKTASQVLKGSEKKTHSYSSFPFLLKDTDEVGAQEDGTEQKGEN